MEDVFKGTFLSFKARKIRQFLAAQSLASIDLRNMIFVPGSRRSTIRSLLPRYSEGRRAGDEG